MDYNYSFRMSHFKEQVTIIQQAKVIKVMQ